jgi:hypothetical protein
MDFGLLMPSRQQPMLDEARSKPAVFEVAVKMRRAVRCMEQQTSFYGREALLVPCDLLMQIVRPSFVK